MRDTLTRPTRTFALLAGLANLAGGALFGCGSDETTASREAALEPVPLATANSRYEPILGSDLVLLTKASKCRFLTLTGHKNNHHPTCGDVDCTKADYPWLSFGPVNAKLISTYLTDNLGIVIQ
jgi:hypothetical protein